MNRSLLLALIWAVSSCTGRYNRFGPSIDDARQNGPRIFNAVHNAMRAFGSALHHNGMSLFPAVIPVSEEGVLLYHGTHTREVPETLEWLAFEIEHAQAFARPRFSRDPPPHSPVDNNQRPDLLRGKWPLEDPLAKQSNGHLARKTTDQGDEGKGYLHIYQAIRPLKVLYIDGMAAAKSDMGTLDTQDYLLRETKDKSARDEFSRARDLCELAQQWDIDGFIRMEIGFEIVYCDFTRGFRLISTHQQPGKTEPGYLNDQSISGAEWARAASQRYRGITSSRVVLDYSSMVSAFFYPVNLTNPNPESAGLPRLSQVTSAELALMREHVKTATLRSAARVERIVDWQGVTDMIVSRYADSFPLIAGTDSLDILRQEINNLLNVHIEYSAQDEGFAAAKQRCISYYLKPVKARTPEDQFIEAAIESTSTAVCTALFEARQLVVESADASGESMQAVKKIFGNLMNALQWSRWKDCGRCGFDELCFVAMWPLGNVEDHIHPSCVSFSSVAERHGYWGMPGPRPPPKELDCERSSSCGKPQTTLDPGEL
ncbi:hypothetical protein F5Y19DRAFT_478938 [Xylariaceae sp. FL1651]|nr:hypothetical protein F5Y19DRAFT_478938 [Xylariaceae sp. FL1651]